jgi:hypothetical protein
MAEPVGGPEVVRERQAADRRMPGTDSAARPRVTSPIDGVTIQILQVPGCPLVGRVRATLQQALARTQLQIDVEELVGDYHSPTLLIGGRDVTGRQRERGASCRMDLPTERQVLIALERLTTVPRTQPPAVAPSATEPGDDSN